MDKRRSFFRDIFKLSDKQLLDELEQSSIFRQWEKGDIVVEIGDTLNNVNFLVDGLFRGYYVNSKGQEVTDCFGNNPGSPLVSCVSLTEPSPICIEFLENSVTISVPVSVIMPLLHNNCEAQYLYNNLLQNSLQMHWEIKQAVSQHTAEERYEWFIKKYPGIINRINHKYVASFLGITPVSLSRVRGKYKA